MTHVTIFFSLVFLIFLLISCRCSKVDLSCLDIIYHPVYSSRFFSNIHTAEVRRSSILLIAVKFFLIKVLPN